MNNAKRRIAAWLCTLLVIPAVVSCADTTDPVQTPTTDNGFSTTEVVTEAVTEATYEGAIARMEGTDFGGYEFRVMDRSDEADPNWVTIDVWSEGETGDTINDAVYQRNEKIESRFNTKISIVSQGATDREATPKFLNKIAMAGDDAAELCAYVNYMAYIPIGQRSCLDWTEVPNVDLTQPWHNKHANDGATVNGKLFAICSDLSISSMTYTSLRPRYSRRQIPSIRQETARP